MYTNIRRTFSDGLCLVDEAVKYCDSDLEVVSMEGAVMKTSKILLALASHSPCLKDILTSDTLPSRLLVPDVPTQSIHHLLNLLTQGYTTGPGSGDAIIKGMKEAAKVLGLVKFPVIAFEVEGNRPGWPSDKNVIQWSTERSEAEKDRNEIVQIDIEDNGDDGEERESSDARDGELMQQSNTLKVLNVEDINKKHLNDSVGDKNEKHLNFSVGDINKKHLNDSVGDKNEKHLNDSVGDINKKHLNDSVGDINKKHLNDSVGDKNEEHLNDSVGDINKKHLNDQQNENQPQRKRRKKTPLVEIVDPKIDRKLGKVRQSSVQLDLEHHKKTNIPPPRNLSHAITCASKGELGEKVIAPTLRDEVLTNLDKMKQKWKSRKNGNLSQPRTTILPKLMSKQNRPMMSGRQQSGGSLLPKSNLPVNLTEKNYDVGNECFSVRKSANHVAITSYSNEVHSATTSSTQPSADTTGRVESASAAPSARKYKEPTKLKPQDPRKPQDPTKPKDTIKTIDPSKVSKMDCEVELKKRYNNQEVTEAVPKVFKAELEEGTGNEKQNQEAVDTILCGICYKSFSFNAGALAVHAETHGSQFGGKGKRKCTQCTHFEGDRTRLLMHMRAKHTKERLFKCNVCNLSFSTCAAKNSHEKKH